MPRNETIPYDDTAKRKRAVERQQRRALRHRFSEARAVACQVIGGVRYAPVVAPTGNVQFDAATHPKPDDLQRWQKDHAPVSWEILTERRTAAQ